MMRHTTFMLAAAYFCLMPMLGRGEDKKPDDDSGKLAELIARLDSKDSQVYLESIKNVGQMKIVPAQAVPYLIRHLKDADGGVREAAANVLGHVTTPESLAALMKAAGVESDIWVKMSFIDAIGAHKSAAKTAVPMLINLLKNAGSYESDSDSCGHTMFSLSVRTVGCSASYALSRIGSSAAIPLAEVYADSKMNASVHEAAGAGLFALGKECHPAKDLLLGVMASGDDDSKHLVMILLALDFPKSVDITNAFYARLADKSQYIQVAAAGFLATLEPENIESLPVLIRGLKSENESTLWRAARELGRLGPKAKGSVPELIGLLKTNDDHLRERVVGTLGEIGPAAFAAVGELKRLESDDPDEGVRSAAKKSLGQIINPK